MHECEFISRSEEGPVPLPANHRRHVHSLSLITDFSFFATHALTADPVPTQQGMKPY